MASYERRPCTFDGCEKPSRNSGLCAVHYRLKCIEESRWEKTDRKGAPKAWVEAMLANPPDECVTWPFGKSPQGYGRAYLDGKAMTASRMVLIMATGRDEPELQAAHGPCHNRLCVNPKHLRWATRSENAHDIKRDRSHPNYRITQEIADQIRSASGVAWRVAKRFGCHVNTVHNIRQGRQWSNQ